MEIPKHLTEVSLRPSWYGKIDWANWRSVSPQLADEYDKRKQNPNKNENWGKYVSPIYDERLEYIRSITEPNKNNKSTNTTNTTNTTTSNQDKSISNQDEFVFFNRKCKSMAKNNTKTQSNFNDNINTNANIYDNQYDDQYDNQYGLESQSMSYNNDNHDNDNDYDDY
jgi:hypothetical protein